MMKNFLVLPRILIIYAFSILINFGCVRANSNTSNFYDNIQGSITPYLIYEGDNTSIKVIWKTDINQESKLDWGDDIYGSSGTFTAPTGISERHAYKISDLTPGKKYYYRISTSEKVATGSFHAAPPETAIRTKLFVFGDTRKSTSTHNIMTGLMVQKYIDDPEFQTIALISGDIVINGKKGKTFWEKDFFAKKNDNILNFQENIPQMIIRGNHDGNGELFKYYFPYPFVQNCYWSFDYGPIHITMADQYEIGGGKISSKQKEWIRNDLALSKKPWKIILLHEPGWSASSNQNGDVKENLQPIAREYNAIVISGHNHYYARAVVDGVNHITTGGGGAPLNFPNAGYPNLVISDRSHHFCTIEVDGNTLVFSAFRLDGSIIERFTLIRD